MLFKKAFLHIKELKLFLVPVLLFFWISSIFEHFLIRKIETFVNSADPNTLSLIGYGSLHLLNGILFPTLVTLLALARIRNIQMHPQQPYAIDGSASEQLFIETLRSWGKTIWWFFAFVIPGLYKYLAYAYVPHVVFLNPAYNNGTIDALAASEVQFNKRRWESIFIFLTFYFIFPIMLSFFLDSYKNFNETPLLALLVSAFNGFLGLFAFLLLAEIYLKDNLIVSAPRP